MSRKKKDAPPSIVPPLALATAEEAADFDLQASSSIAPIAPTAPTAPTQELVVVPEPPLSGKIVTNIRVIGTLINIMEDHRSNARADAAEQLVKIIEKARLAGVGAGIEIDRLYGRLMSFVLEGVTSDRDRVRFAALVVALEQ